jgi:redox-sensitive bicupin YhaK (pirin superfamily)
MTYRNIRGIYQGPAPHMVGDGFRVRNYFPNQQLPFHAVSPFLMMDYHAPHVYPPTQQQRGVGAHPHRGFETVTLVYEGEVAHRDTAGNSGVIGAGEVQWMTAASGVLHEEFHEKAFAAAGGTLHSVQLWVNLPREHKMSAPQYQAITRDLIPEVAVGKGLVRVIAGEFQGVKGPARSFTPVTLLDVRLKAGDTFDFSLPNDYNVLVLVAQGKARINGETPAQEQDFVAFDHAAEAIQVTATEDSMLLVLGGEPIREPVASYGPFVMNTKMEIIQAFEDLESGKFGVLV